MPIQEIIYTSDVLAKQHIKLAEKIQADPGIQWGIPAIDRVVIPMRGGDIGVILGRPSDGKSSVLCYHAAHQAGLIERAGLQNEQTVVYVTWEGTVDTIYAAIIAGRSEYSKTDYLWGRVSIDRITAAALHRGVIPITFIGFSTLRKTGYKSITLDMILEAIEAINEGSGTPKRKVRAIYCDYLQLIPMPGSTGRTESTSDAVIAMKQLGMRLDIPVLTAAQARREVDSYIVKLASAGDGQWSSQIEQHVDYGFSVWRPIRTEPYDERTPQQLNVWGRRIELTPNLLIMKNWKQRNDQTGMWWPLYFRPEIIRLAELELE